MPQTLHGALTPRPHIAPGRDAPPAGIRKDQAPMRKRYVTSGRPSLAS